LCRCERPAAHFLETVPANLPCVSYFDPEVRSELQWRVKQDILLGYYGPKDNSIIHSNAAHVTGLVHVDGLCIKIQFELNIGSDNTTGRESINFFQVTNFFLFATFHSLFLASALRMHKKTSV
jgi:hypothetical protein